MEEEAKEGSAHPLLFLDGGFDDGFHGVEHSGTRVGVEASGELPRGIAVEEEEEEKKRQISTRKSAGEIIIGKGSHWSRTCQLSDGVCMEHVASADI